jgi:hypothetical protein
VFQRFFRKEFKMKTILLTAGFAFGAAAVFLLKPTNQPLQPHLRFDNTPMKAGFRTPKQIHQYRFMGGPPWWLER